MKKRIQHLMQCIKLLFVILGACSLFFSQVCKVLAEFSYLTKDDAVRTGLACVVLTTVVIFSYVVTRKTRAQRIRLSLWISTHIAAIDLFYALPLILLASITPEIVSEIHDMQELISLSWTIFGITVAIYLLWYLFLPEYLEGKIPDFKAYKPEQTLKSIQERDRFHEQVGLYFNTTTLVVINLIILVMATGMIYLPTEGLTLVNQNAARFSFYLCVNTIILLFLDILKPFQEKRNELLEKTRVTNEEIDNQAEEDTATGQTDGPHHMADAVPARNEQNTDATKKEKKKRRKERCKNPLAKKPCMKVRYKNKTYRASLHDGMFVLGKRLHLYLRRQSRRLRVLFCKQDLALYALITVFWLLFGIICVVGQHDVTPDGQLVLPQDVLWDVLEGWFSSGVLSFVIGAFTRVAEYKKKIRLQYHLYISTLEDFEELADICIGQELNGYHSFYCDRCLDDTISYIKQNGKHISTWQNNDTAIALSAIQERLEKLVEEVRTENLIFFGKSLTVGEIESVRRKLIQYTIEDTIGPNEASDLLLSLSSVLEGVRQPWRIDIEHKVSVLQKLNKYPENHIMDDVQYKMLLEGEQFPSSKGEPIEKMKPNFLHKKTSLRDLMMRKE